MSDLLLFARGLLKVAAEVLTQRWRLRDVPSIDSIGDSAEGLTYIVTGPTSGIGTETAAALLRRKAHVVLACRDQGRGEKLKRLLEEQTEISGNNKLGAEVMLLDVSSLQSVRSFAQAWNQRPLHGLINNAGIFDVGSSHGYAKSKDGFELHMATNYLGPFLLTMLLLPTLQQSGTPALQNGRLSFEGGSTTMAAVQKAHVHQSQLQLNEQPARVVNVSSTMADTCTLSMADPQLTQPGAWSGVRAYSQSKLCQILCTAECRRRLGADTRVFVCATDPGVVITNVVRTTPGWLQYLYRILLTQLLMSPKQGARSSVHCATCKHISSERDPSQCLFSAACKLLMPKASNVDPVAGKWLWNWSAKATGLPAGLDLAEEGANASR